MSEIVVGVDGTAASLDALRWAEATAGAGTVVRAVYAWTYPVGIGGDVGMSLQAYPIADLEAVARETLEAALAAVPPGEVERRPETIMAGSPAGGLLEAAEGADLLVVGTRAHSTTDRILVGSVAIRCAQHSPCPFVGVPESPAPGDGTLVVAFDGSPPSAEALRWAVDVAATRGSTVRVVAVWDAPGGSGRPRVDLAHLPVEDRAEIRLHEAVEAVVGDRVEDLELRPVEGDGSVVDQVLAAAEGADAVVVGSRGRGGFVGLLLGSVSQRLLETAPVPVVVVREGVTAG